MEEIITDEQQEIVGNTIEALIKLERACSDEDGQPKAPDSATLFLARLQVAELKQFAERENGASIQDNGAD